MASAAFVDALMKPLSQLQKANSNPKSVAGMRKEDQLREGVQQSTACAVAVLCVRMSARRRLTVGGGDVSTCSCAGGIGRKVGDWRGSK